MARQPAAPVTKARAAFHRIRWAAEGGRLKPGGRSSTAALRGEPGMSPTPIREALRPPASTLPLDLGAGLVHAPAPFSYPIRPRTR